MEDAAATLDATEAGGRCPIDHAAIAAEQARQGAPAERSLADQRMRRLLRIDPLAPKVSLVQANRAFERSVTVSAIRCITTYLLLPFVLPLIGLSGAVGPFVSIALSVVSVTFITISARRFFGSDHPWRWVHAVIGAIILTVLAVSAVFDVLNIANVI
ncbi:MAG: hypothetical protein KDB35_09085 [Acidimicrobiales bacterium]|nr:hypothetical protein [Acidimicrobiales bacterium]MCB1016949.1 hypothetical protein [Acidimicrobiales bacterium]MCB9371635.1 hypothetical protein [Microthrixaceae bacterium]